MLHPKAAEQVLTLLKKNIRYLKVDKGMWLDRISAFMAFFEANKVLPQQGKLADNLQYWIGDLPLLEFLSDTLADELYLHGTYETDGKKYIYEVNGYEDTDRLSERLLSSFQTLPWSYALTIPVGQRITPPLKNDQTRLPLMNGVNLLTSDLFLKETFPLVSEDEAINRRFRGSGLLIFLNDEVPEWSAQEVHFQVTTIGFVGPYGGGSVMDRAVSHLRSFFGLGLALNLFEHEYRYDTKQGDSHWVVHRQQGETWNLSHKVKLNDEDARTLSETKLWNSFPENYPEEQKLPWLQGVLNRVALALKSESSENLQLACQWFWDSYKGHDEILRYVRRMISLEILLGEGANTSEASLGDIMGNRLAYLIGKTHKQRIETVEKFKKIYNIRSRILHRGQRRIVGEERLYLSELERLCKAALKEEAAVIAASNETAVR